MLQKTLFQVDQKTGATPRNIAELIAFCRKHFPGVDLANITLELGVVSITLTQDKSSFKRRRRVRWTTKSSR